STLLQYFRKTTKKNVVVLAPTGVAALNVEGQTIHSFCSFGPDITLSKVKKLAPFNPKLKLLKNLDTLIIDEISMVRADLFDFVELKTIYRQKDQVFKDVLNAVRNNLASQEHLKLLNSRASTEGSKFTFEKFAIYLTPTNQRARQINNFFLEKISTEIKTYQ